MNDMFEERRKRVSLNYTENCTNFSYTLHSPTQKAAAKLPGNLECEIRQKIVFMFEWQLIVAYTYEHI